MVDAKLTLTLKNGNETKEKFVVTKIGTNNKIEISEENILSNIAMGLQCCLESLKTWMSQESKEIDFDDILNDENPSKDHLFYPDLSNTLVQL